MFKRFVCYFGSFLFLILLGGLTLLLLIPIPGVGEAGWTHGVLTPFQALGGLANEGVVTIAVLFMATAVQAAESYEPYGGKLNYMTFSLGGYWIRKRKLR